MAAELTPKNSSALPARLGGGARFRRADVRACQRPSARSVAGGTFPPPTCLRETTDSSSRGGTSDRQDLYPRSRRAPLAACAGADHHRPAAARHHDHRADAAAAPSAPTGARDAGGGESATERGLAGVLVGGGIALLDNGDHWQRDLMIGTGAGILAGVGVGIVQAVIEANDSPRTRAVADQVRPAGARVPGGTALAFSGRW